MSGRRGKKEITEILKPYITTAIIAAAAVVVFMLIWLAAGDGLRKSSPRNFGQTQTAQTQTGPNGQTGDAAQTPDGGAANAGSGSQGAVPSGDGSQGTTQNGATGGADANADANNAAGGADANANTNGADTDANIQAPTADDGSGRAGVQRASQEMLAVSERAGKYSNELGSWYAPRDGYCYYNGWVTLDGNKYHFNTSGYMDTGWKAIGGKGCYFDETGVYDANKDSSKMIALTFDDGPSKYTNEVLDVLEQYGAKATFMMLGTEVEKYGDDVIPRMVSMGNTIGNHSKDHPDMVDLTPEQAAANFQFTDDVLAKYGLSSAVVRFPYGDYTKDHTAAVGKPQIFWDVDSRDWDSRDPAKIIDEIYKELMPGSIILMHDIYPETAEAVRQLVPRLIDEGYELVNIQDLAASRGYELKGGVTYFSFKQLNIDQGRVNDE